MVCPDKHSNLHLVMVSVMSSIPKGGRQLLAEIFKPLDVNSGLKCKYDLIVKNSVPILQRNLLSVDIFTTL